MIPFRSYCRPEDLPKSVGEWIYVLICYAVIAAMVIGGTIGAVRVFVGLLT